MSGSLMQSPFAGAASAGSLWLAGNGDPGRYPSHEPRILQPTKDMHGRGIIGSGVGVDGGQCARGGGGGGRDLLGGLTAELCSVELPSDLHELLGDMGQDAEMATGSDAVEHTAQWAKKDVKMLAGEKPCSSSLMNHACTGESSFVNDAIHGNRTSHMFISGSLVQPAQAQFDHIHHQHHHHYDHHYACIQSHYHQHSYNCHINLTSQLPQQVVPQQLSKQHSLGPVGCTAKDNSCGTLSTTPTSLAIASPTNVPLPTSGGGVQQLQLGGDCSYFSSRSSSSAGPAAGRNCQQQQPQPCTATAWGAMLSEVVTTGIPTAHSSSNLCVGFGGGYSRHASSGGSEGRDTVMAARVEVGRHQQDCFERRATPSSGGDRGGDNVDDSLYPGAPDGKGFVHFCDQPGSCVLPATARITYGGSEPLAPALTAAAVVVQHSVEQRVTAAAPHQQKPAQRAAVTRRPDSDSLDPAAFRGLTYQVVHDLYRLLQLRPLEVKFHIGKGGLPPAALLHLATVIGDVEDLKRSIDELYERGGYPAQKLLGALRDKLREWACHLWGLVNLPNPYPDQATKKALAAYTGLEDGQVDDWFVNWRSRSWHPAVKQAIAKAERRSGGLMAAVGGGGDPSLPPSSSPAPAPPSSSSLRPPAASTGRHRPRRR